MNVNSTIQKKRKSHKMKLWRSGSAVLMVPCVQYPVSAKRMAFWLAVLAAPSGNAQPVVEPVEAAASTPEAAASAPEKAASAPEKAAPAVEKAVPAVEKAASSPEKAQVELQRVEIKGSLGRIKHSNTATRLDVETRDVPASVQVVSPQTVQEQSKSQTVNDVLRNVSGVSQNYGTASGNQPNVMLRGFETGGWVLQDGYVRAGWNTYDWSSIQQIEVLKGPASVLYGQQANIGGMINILSKKPLSAPLAELELSVGRWGYKRGTVDLGGPLNEGRTLTYRLNLATETSDSFRDYIFEKRLFVAPSIKWDIGPDDSLLLNGDLMDRKYRQDRGLPAPSQTAWVGNEYPGLPHDQLGYALPINTYIGYANWDANHERSGRLAVEWEHDINEAWHMKVSFLRDKNHITSRDSNYAWFQPTDDAGQPSGPLLNLLQAHTRGSRFQSTQANVDLSGEFETRGIKHKLLGGISSMNGSSISSPSENTFLMAQETLGDDAWRNPGANYTLVPDPTVSFFEEINSQKHKGLYVQDMLEFSSRWKALVGYRYHVAQGNYSLRVNDNVSLDEFTVTGGTPRLGAVWQPTKTLALYTGWSKSFNPNWGRLAGGGLAPPEMGTQYEVGLKKDFADGKVNLNVAAYRIDKTNVERCAPVSPDCRLYVLVGGQRSQGLELDLNGEVLPNLRLSMAMTLQDAKVVEDLPADQGGVPVGNKLVGVPRWIFNLYGSYKFKTGKFAGLGIGGGLNTSADTEANLPNDIYRIPGNRRLDLVAEYSFTPKTKVQLNINNVTDQINYSSPATGMLTFANKPREAVLTLTTRQ